MRIPKDRIYYRPALAEVLKQGWIQYISLFFLVLGIIWPFYDFLVYHQVIRTHITVDPIGPDQPKHLF